LAGCRQQLPELEAILVAIPAFRAGLSGRKCSLRESGVPQISGFASDTRK
jgi:hypothetical protein